MNMKKHAVLAVALATGLCGVSWAGSPAAGPGQITPNTRDLSTAPGFHVYASVLHGITFLQVNDQNGIVGSIGTAHGQFITLPVGRFAQLVTTPGQPAAVAATAPATAAPVQVYNDGTTLLTVVPLADGSTQLNAMQTNQACDPIDCNLKGVTQAIQ